MKEGLLKEFLYATFSFVFVIGGFYLSIVFWEFVLKVNVIELIKNII